MNKKGHIPTAMIPVLALVLSGIVFFSYIGFKGNLNENSEDISILILDAGLKEKEADILFRNMVRETLAEINGPELAGNFESDFRNKLREIAERERDPRFGNLYLRLIEQSTDSFFFFKEQEAYTLIVEDIFVRSSIGGNEIKRDFNLEVKFNEDEVVS